MTVQTPSARGAATLYKYRARNLITKQKVDIVLKGTDSLDEADFSRRPVKYMYSDATDVFFLDQQDYNQYSLAKEDLVRNAVHHRRVGRGPGPDLQRRVCGIQPPVTVELKVTQCEPVARATRRPDVPSRRPLKRGW